MSARDRYSQSYSPSDDEYDTFDAREDGHGRRGPILLLAAAVVLVLFLGVVWSAYNLGVRERNTAPILTADNQPWRVAPENPGGFETPGQDIEAYSLRERERVDTAEIDAAVRPGPEEPVTAPERPPLTVETADADRLDSAAEPTPDPEPEPVRQPDPEPEPVRQAESSRPSQAETPAPTSTPPAASTASTSGNFVVQIAAFRTTDEAEDAWINFVSRFPDLARGRGPSIVEANLGARGIYHRLRIAGFETRDEASRYCQTLSSRGQDCLVAAR